MNGSVYDRFTEMEEKEGLPEMKWKDFYPWGYIRKHVYFLIKYQYEKPERYGEAPALMPDLKQAGRIIKGYIRSLKRAPLNKTDVVFMTSTNRMFYKGEYWCMYTDLIADLYDENKVSLEPPDYSKINGPVHTKNLFYIGIPNLIAAVFNLLYRTRIKQSFLNAEEKKALTAVASRIENAVRKYFDNIKAEGIFSQLATYYLVWKQKKAYYTRVLRKLSPRVLVWARWGFSAMVMTDAAKSLHIPVIELQHGAIGKEDMRYSFSGIHSVPYVPDYMCLWGDYWKENIHYALPPEHLISCGYPFFEEQRLSYPQETHETLSIIVISQPGTARIIGEAIEVFVSLMEESRKRYRLYYKLHPNEYDENYPFLSRIVSDNVTVIRDSSVTVYELFSKTDIQIGAYSTALFEGLSYGLKTYIIDNMKAESFMGGLIDRGYVKLIKDGKELYEDINKGGSQVPFDGELFFKRDALKNIKNVIDGFLS